MPESNSQLWQLILLAMEEVWYITEYWYFQLFEKKTFIQGEIQKYSHLAFETEMWIS